MCENCGYTCRCPEFPRRHTRECKLQAAHVRSRRYSNTRTDLENAVCLCARCHAYYTDHPHEFGVWLLGERGQEWHDALVARSHQLTKVDWEAEVDRLRGIAKAGGLV